MPIDNDIISAMREEPEKGFNKLMAVYMRPIYWHIRRLVVAHDDAQDVLQETLVRIFHAFDQYNPQFSLKSWIFRIATNESLRFLEHQRGKNILSLEDAPEDVFNLKADEYVDYSDVLAVKLQQAVHILPLKQQLAFNLRYFDELSYEEIATITGFEKNNIKANYHIAKEKIVQYIKNHD